MIRAAAVLALAVVPTVSHASVLATDDFTDADGTFVGAAGGTGWEYT